MSIKEAGDQEDAAASSKYLYQIIERISVVKK